MNPYVSNGGGLTGLVPVLSVLFIFGGVIIWAWMSRHTRVAVRRGLGTWHARHFGAITPAIGADTTDTVAEATAPPTDSPLAGLDAEKAAFGLDMFGPRRTE